MNADFIDTIDTDLLLGKHVNLFNEKLTAAYQETVKQLNTWMLMERIELENKYKSRLQSLKHHFQLLQDQYFDQFKEEIKSISDRLPKIDIKFVEQDLIRQVFENMINRSSMVLEHQILGRVDKIPVDLFLDKSKEEDSKKDESTMTEILPVTACDTSTKVGIPLDKFILTVEEKEKRELEKTNVMPPQKIVSKTLIVYPKTTTPKHQRVELLFELSTAFYRLLLHANTNSIMVLRKQNEDDLNYFLDRFQNIKDCSKLRKESFVIPLDHIRDACMATEQRDLYILTDEIIHIYDGSSAKGIGEVPFKYKNAQSITATSEYFVVKTLNEVVLFDVESREELAVWRQEELSKFNLINMTKTLIGLNGPEECAFYKFKKGEENTPIHHLNIITGSCSISIYNTSKGFGRLEYFLINNTLQKIMMCSSCKVKETLSINSPQQCFAVGKMNGHPQCIVLSKEPSMVYRITMR